MTGSEKHCNWYNHFGNMVKPISTLKARHRMVLCSKRENLWRRQPFCNHFSVWVSIFLLLFCTLIHPVNHYLIEFMVILNVQNLVEAVQSFWFLSSLPKLEILINQIWHKTHFISWISKRRKEQDMKRAGGSGTSCSGWSDIYHQ